MMLYHINEQFETGVGDAMKPCLRRELIRLAAKVAEVHSNSKILTFMLKRTKDTLDSNM